MKNIVSRLFAIAMTMLVCVSMWGCGLFDEDVSHEVHEKRHSGLVVAILDDSLALETNGRGWTDHTESCDYWENCDGGTINQGLFLVNYRNKQRPLWGDTIDGVITIIWGLAADSTVLFYDKKENFGFWKVGKLPDVRKKIKIEDGCAWNDPYTRAKPWINGKILLKDMYPCPFAVLDTVSGIVKKLEFTGEYTWLDGCDDITYIDGDVACLRQRGDRLCEVDFEKKGEIVDSLIKSEWMMGDPPYFMGNAARLPVYTWDKEDPAHNFGDRIALIGKNGFVFENYPETWLKYNSFVDSTGFSISYSSDDLVITK